MLKNDGGSDDDRILDLPSKVLIFFACACCWEEIVMCVKIKSCIKFPFEGICKIYSIIRLQKKNMKQLNANALSFFDFFIDEGLTIASFSLLFCAFYCSLGVNAY